jgi:hypothetical protein
MGEKSTGIKTTNADTYVATFLASEEAEGKQRVVQIISLTAGKVDSSLGSPARTVSFNDSSDISTLTGNIEVGDNYYLACYVRHSQLNGSCLVTPVLCDNNGTPMGLLESKKSQVQLTVTSGIDYFSKCLSWEVAGTGAWKINAYISDLSVGNSIQLWCYTF